MNIGKNFPSSKKRHRSGNSKKLQILKKSKKQHQAAVTGTMMFLKKVWTFQAVEVFFLIA